MAADASTSMGLGFGLLGEGLGGMYRDLGFHRRTDVQVSAVVPGLVGSGFFWKKGSGEGGSM